MMMNSPAASGSRQWRFGRACALLTCLVLMSGVVPSTVATAQVLSIQPLVFGGVDADINDLPSLAFVSIAGEPGSGTGAGCTATVIDPEWVLTAAHCFTSLDPEVVQVFTGRADLGELTFEDVSFAAAVVVHPDWEDLANRFGVHGDIALVRLSEPIDVPVQPLVAAGTPVPVGVSAVIAGWGATVAEQSSATAVLQRAEVPVVDGSECVIFYGPAQFDRDRHLCAGAGTDQANTCKGDSGGPLLLERDGMFVQYGVTNYGQDAACGEQQAPSAYAAVAHYRPWIEQVMSDGAPLDLPPDPVEDPAGDDDAAAPDPPPDGSPQGPDAPPVPEVDAPDAQPPVLLDDAGIRLLDPACSDAPVGNFTDVSGVHLPGIDCIGWWGVTLGAGDGTYGPGFEVTRAQMATFIARAVLLTGGELPAAPPVAFADTVGDTHQVAIDQLAAIGVVGGLDEGRYDPGGPVTRAQMASFLARAWAARTGEELPVGQVAFGDVAGNVHADNIGRIATAGLTGGTEPNVYHPSGLVTRAQMGTFLARLLAMLVAEGYATSPG